MYPQDKYVVQLSHDGDPTEKAAIKRYELGYKFPNYAKFWWQFVVPNRDERDSSKLREDFPSSIEEIFNTHYSIFYQLTYAYGQIAFLTKVESSNSEPPNCFVELASPFYHLASAIDLINQIFVATVRLNRPDLIEKISKEKYDKKAAKRWEDYEDSFQAGGAIENIVCIFQSVDALFLKALPDSNAKSAFNEVQTHIRRYRNKFIHGISPLRIMKNDKVCFPSEDYVLHYSTGRWSAARNDINPDHYEPALEVMTRLADKLLDSTNSLWNALIDEMDKYASVPSNEVKIQSEPPAEPMYRSVPYQPPTTPSGINIDAMGSAEYLPDKKPPQNE